MKVSIEKHIDKRSKGKFNKNGNRTGTGKYEVEIEILVLTPETDEDKAAFLKKVVGYEEGESIKVPVMDAISYLVGV